jgi:hypothetical protein
VKKETVQLRNGMGGREEGKKEDSEERQDNFYGGGRM